jgi:hypothetical protein
MSEFRRKQQEERKRLDKAKTKWHSEQVGALSGLHIMLLFGHAPPSTDLFSNSCRTIHVPLKCFTTAFFP